MKNYYELKMKSAFLTILFSLTLVLNGVAQKTTSVDSLKATLEKASGKQRLTLLLSLSKFKSSDFKRVEEAYDFATEAKELANTLEDQSSYIRALVSQGVAMGSLGKRDSGIDTLTRALSLAKQLQNDSIIAECYFKLGVEQGKNDDLTSAALGSYKQSVKIFTALHDTVYLSFALNNLGIVNFHLGNLNTALDYYLQTLSLKERMKGETQLGKTYNNIALVYKVMGNFEKALVYNHKSVERQKLEKDTSSLSINYWNIGNIYLGMKKYDSAIINQEMALMLSEHIQDTAGIARAKYSLGSVYYNLKDYKKSEALYLTSLAIFAKRNVTSGVIRCYTSLATVNRETGNIPKATQYALRALTLAQGLNDRSELKSLYETLYLLSKDKGDFKESLLYHEKFTAYSDSLLNEQKVDAIKNLETNFEIEQRDTEIELLNKNEELNILALSQAKMKGILLTALSVLLLLILVVIYRNLKIKRKTEKELEEKNSQLKELNAAKDKFFTIIAHDLRNPLSAFQSLSTGLYENFKKLPEDDLQHYLKNLKNSSEQLVNLLQNLLQWTLSQTQNLKTSKESIDLSSLLQKSIGLLEESAAQKNILIRSEIISDSKAYGDSQTIDLVFRNLISNAIKFTNPGGEVVVKTIKKGNNIIISFRDTGIGMTEEDTKRLFSIVEDTSRIGKSKEKGTGLGLILCKEFINKNDGQIDVTSKIGEGTTFNVVLPLPNYENAA